MMSDAKKPHEVEALLDTPELAGVLESEQFRHFLDHLPIAIAVSDVSENERIIYSNPDFEAICGMASELLEGSSWLSLPGSAADGKEDGRRLGEAVVAGCDAIGVFRIERPDGEVSVVEVFANLIANEQHQPVFRLVALVDLGERQEHDILEMRERIRQKDTLLREIQHRVRNNLQMIVALIRMEERNTAAPAVDRPFTRLAGRVEALQVLYDQLALESLEDEVDLGSYLGQIATAVMRANAVEGIRLNLKVDSYKVSVNVAMPTGLVVNELLTNALKHAFANGAGGTITLHCLSDGNGSRVVVSDDGVGLPVGVEWPQRGKLAALIVRSLRENARADILVDSISGAGTTVTISFRAPFTGE